MLTNTERQQIVEEVNAGTYGIDEALDDIAAAQKGEEVRKALYAEALVLNREGHAGSTDMIARQKIANLQTSVNGQISTLRTEVGDDIDDLEEALNSGLATQNGRIAAQNATIANVVANYNVEYGSTELWASTGETGALAAGTTVTLSEDVSHFDYIDIYSFCGNSNVLDTVPVDAKLQSSQGYALRWVNLSDPGSGSYKAYVRIIETRLHIIGTTLTIDHQVTYRNGEEVNISGAEITQSNRSTYMGELGIMKVVGRKITANTEIEDVRIGADGTEYASAGQAVRAQVTALESAIPAVDSTLSTQGAAADAKVAGDKVAELKSALTNPDYSWAYGRYISSSGVAGNDSHYAISTLISCKPGDVLQNLSPTNDGNNHTFTYWLNFYSDGVWQSRQSFYGAGITVPSGIDGFRFSVGIDDVTMTEDIISTYFRPSFFLQGIAYDSLKKAVDDLYNQNSVNLLEKVAVRVLNSNGIVFDNRGNSTCAIKGTATADSFINLVDLSSGLTLPFEAGATYVLEGHTVNAKVQMAIMKNGAVTQLVTATDGRKAVTIPADADGLTIRVFVPSGKTVNEVVKYACYNSYSNKELTSAVVPITEKTLFDVKKGLFGSCDLNDVLEDGSYLMVDGETYENAPVGVSSIGMLNVYHPNTVYMQVFIPFTPKDIYIRRLLAGGTWTDWYKVSGGGTNNFIKYSNTYDISVSPSISSDATYYLPPTNDTTDRTAEIVALLQTQGICRLGAGRYYVKNLAMPNRSMIIGSGPATRIVLADGDGFAISLGTACTVKDAWIMGASEITPSETLGERNGIVWAGTYTDDQTAPSRSTIENLHITSFTGGGIVCYDTGYATQSCIEVSNVYCYNCGAGVNISYWSEFNKFTNVHCTNNWYGCINNGGNNMFVNCDFSSNHIGFLMDNEHNQSPNNSHGSAVGCVFNHSDNNTGIGIKILNCDNGFIFDGCQVFFSQIFVANSDGVAFTNCNMGASNCNITIGGGGVILFANNLHQAGPTISISGNNNVHFTNCYVRSTGEAVSA